MYCTSILVSTINASTGTQSFLMVVIKTATASAAAKEYSLVALALCLQSPEIFLIQFDHDK